jgi:hypothetical protein
MVSRIFFESWSLVILRLEVSTTPYSKQAKATAATCQRKGSGDREMGRLPKQRCTVAVACRHAQASLALQREGQNGTGSKPLNSLTPPPCMHACRGPVVLPAPGQKPVRPAVRTVRCPQSGPGPRQPQASKQAPTYACHLHLPSASSLPGAGDPVALRSVHSACVELNRNEQWPRELSCCCV